MIARRGVLGVVAAGALVPASFAQAISRSYRVGVLTPSESQWQPDVFRLALRDLGYEEGKNLTLVIRDAAGRLERLPTLAADLVAARVDVVAAVNTPGAKAAIAATQVVPIVMTVVGDPLATGLVPNLARPGGNATGVSNLGRDLTEKRLQLLTEAVSGARRIAVLLHPDDPVVVPQVEDVKAAALRLGVEARFVSVRSTGELPAAFATMREWQAEALLRLFGQAFATSAGTIALAAEHRLPTMMLTKDEVAAGGLMSYDADRAQLFRRAAFFVDKILKGAKPGELPIEQPTKFEFVINLKTAAALGLNMPLSLLARADEVIE